MSGHNKWSKIKHKKAVEDAKKSKVFGKLSKLITMEAKQADGDLDSPGLKLAIERAKAENMPNDNIERAIKRATESGAGDVEALVYEAYLLGGGAIIIQILTDNRNRTASEIKHLLSKHNITLAEPGAALWAFEEKGGAYTPKTEVYVGKEEFLKNEKIVEALLDHDDVGEVYKNYTL